MLSLRFYETFKYNPSIYFSTTACHSVDHALWSVPDVTSPSSTKTNAWYVRSILSSDTIAHLTANYEERLCMNTSATSKGMIYLLRRPAGPVAGYVPTAMSSPSTSENPLIDYAYAL